MFYHHTESVSWISGRTDLIATVFSLASVLTFMAIMRRGSITLILSAELLFIAALLAKESAIIVPVVWLILYSVRHSEQRDRKHSRFALWTLICWIPIMVGYLFLRKTVLGHFIGGLGINRHLAFLDAQSIGNLLRYAARIMMPPFPHSTGDLVSSVIILGLAAILGFLVVRFLIAMFRGRIQRQKTGLCLMLAASSLVCLMPVLTLKISLFDTRSERFLYMPSAFACILAGVVITLLFKKTRRIIAVFFILLSLEFIALQRVNSNWATAGDLSEHISAQVSGYDPDFTLIINIPDNLCGAYIFRNGLTEAATTFHGINMEGHYRIVCTHSLLTEEDFILANADSGCVVLILPDELEFCMIDSLGQRARLRGDTLIIEVQGASDLVFFNQGSMWALMSKEP